MNNLYLLFDKFSDNIIKCKEFVDTIKIIEKTPNNIYNLNNNIVLKYIDRYKKKYRNRSVY